MPDRPLSPHAGVYKFKYTIVSSFLNRLTGIALSVGLIPLVCWLMALADGPKAYDEAVVTLSNPFFKLIYVGLAFSFCYHLLAGIRHLVWDTGRGMERRQSQVSAWVIIILSIVLTVLLLGALVATRGLV